MDKLSPLVEKLAQEAHNVWVAWSKEIAIRFKTEDFFKDQIEQWQKSWIPYSLLPESQKALDRDIARNYLGIVIHHYNKILATKIEFKISDESKKVKIGDEPVSIEPDDPLYGVEN